MRDGRPNPLWRAAPLVLLRFRGLFLAVAAGAALLAATVASGPLFVSSITAAALHEELEGYTAFGAGASLVQTGVPVRLPGASPSLGERIERGNRAATGELDDLESLGEPVVTVLGTPALPSAGRSSEPGRPVRLLARTDAPAHVSRVAGSEGDGVWVSDEVARALGLGPGDTFFLRSDVGTAPVELHVDGTYRALWKQRTTPFWRSLTNYVYPQNPDAPPPATFVLADLDQVLDASTSLGEEFVEIRREWPLADFAISTPDADGLAARLTAFQRAAQDPSTSLGEALYCPACPTGFGGPELQYSSQLPAALETARDRASLVRGPVDLLTAAGALATLAVLATSAAFALGSRRSEMSLLLAQGASASAVGVRSAVEALLPALAGTIVGGALAFGAVAVLAPGTADAGAFRRALLAAALAVPATLLVVGLVAALRFARLEPRRSERGHLLERVPWELVGVAVGAYALLRLRSNGASTETDEARSDVGLVAFPVLVVGGAAFAASRVLHWVLERLRRGKRPAGPASYLALRRVLGSGRLAGLLMATAALAVGILVYAQTLVASLEATAEARAALFVGGDVQGYTSADREIPPGFPHPATMVTKLPEAASLERVPADVLGIDPETFAGPTLWDEGWADRPLADLLDELGRPSGGRVPAVLVGPAPDSADLRLAGLSVPLDVVGRADAFPGMRLRGVTVVVSRDALAAFADESGAPDPFRSGGSETQVWASGETGAVLADLETSILRPFPVLTAEEVRANPAIRSATQTFDFLSALGAAAGLLVAAGTLLYLQARGRARAVSYELARRMGLRAAAHRLAATLELGWMLIGGAVLGAVLAVGAARLAIPEVDAPVEIPAGPLVRIPWALVALTLTALVAVAVAAGFYAHRSARRARIAEVLRAAD